MTYLPALTLCRSAVWEWSFPALAWLSLPCAVGLPCDFVEG